MSHQKKRTITILTLKFQNIYIRYTHERSMLRAILLIHTNGRKSLNSIAMDKGDFPLILTTHMSPTFPNTIASIMSKITLVYY